VTKQKDDYSLEIKIKIYQEDKENGLRIAEFVKKEGPSIKFYKFLDKITKEIKALAN